MIRKLFACLALSFVCLAECIAAQFDGDTIRYASPQDVSIEDVFFSRFDEFIYHVDSTMHAQRVEYTPKLNAESWEKNFKTLSLWGASKENAVDTYNAAVRMFLKNPKAVYADIAERALYNGVLAEIDSLRSGNKSWRNAAQAVLDAPATAYAYRGSDLWINLYYRNRAYIKNDSLDMVVLQNTSSPWNANVFISMKFNNDNPHMRLHLRLPAWLRGEVTPSGEFNYNKTREFYQVVLNGKNLALRASSDGYITIDRIWQSDDVIRFSMQTAVRRIRPAGKTSGSFAVQEGPILYTYESRGNKTYFDSAAAFGNSYDKEVLHTNSLITKTYTSPNPAGDTPWDGVLLPYYITFGRNLFKPQIWLEEVEK